MKIWIFAGIMLLLLSMVHAVKTIDVVLKPGESFFVDGKNITLLESVNGSTKLCINNENFIVSKDKRISNIFVDFRKASYDQASFKLTFDCLKDCQCDGEECNNNACCFELEVNDDLIESDSSNKTEELIFECDKDLDCEDNGICTLDICEDNLCKYETILGCGVLLDNKQDTQINDKTFEYLAFTLLGIALLLGIFAIFKLSMKKKKRK